MSNPMTEVFHDANGTWLVDWTLVRAILRSNANARAMIEHGQINRMTRSQWFNPVSWGMPEEVTYEVDWSAQRMARERHLEQYMNSVANAPDALGFEGFRNYLHMRVEEADRDRRTFRDRMRSATSETMDNIESSVDNYETAVSRTRTVRDLSADVVLVGATFMTGGAAVAVAAAGSTAKGAFSYQDTGNVGLAVLEANVSFVATLIPITRTSMVPASASRTLLERGTERGAILMIGAQFDVAKGLVSGDTLGQATLRALTNQASNQALGAALASRSAQSLISRLPLPTTIRISPGNPAISPGTPAQFVEGVLGAAGGVMVSSPLAGLSAGALSPAQRAGTSRRGANSVEPPVCRASELTCAHRDLVRTAVRRISSQ